MKLLRLWDVPSTIRQPLVSRFETMTAITPLRADILMALKSIQSKVKNASADAKSRAHFQNISDMIERALVVK